MARKNKWDRHSFAIKKETKRKLKYRFIGYKNAKLYIFFVNFGLSRLQFSSIFGQKFVTIVTKILLGFKGTIVSDLSFIMGPKNISIFSNKKIDSTYDFKIDGTYQRSIWIA